MRRRAPKADRGSRWPREILRRVRWLCPALGLICGGCLRATAFECDADDQCVRNDQAGRCEDQGVCSYLDPACPSGRSYSPNAGALAGECLSAQDTEQSTDEGTTSMTICGGASTTDDGCTDCIAFEVDARAFLACASPLTFSTADAACATHGLRLASIHSDAENEAVGEVIPWPDTYWIGLSDRDLEQQWQWVDGSMVDYFGWGPGEPDDVDSVEDCVAITSPGTWSMQRCGLPNAYVCAAAP